MSDMDGAVSVVLEGARSGGMPFVYRVAERYGVDENELRAAVHARVAATGTAKVPVFIVDSPDGDFDYIGSDERIAQRIYNALAGAGARMWRNGKVARESPQPAEA